MNTNIPYNIFGPCKIDNRWWKCLRQRFFKFPMWHRRSKRKQFLREYEFINSNRFIFPIWVLFIDNYIRSELFGRVSFCFCHFHLEVYAQFYHSTRDSLPWTKFCNSNEHCDSSRRPTSSNIKSNLSYRSD